MAVFELADVGPVYLGFEGSAATLKELSKGRSAPTACGRKTQLPYRPGTPSNSWVLACGRIKLIT